MQNRETRVGVGVFVLKGGKFLMLKRQGSHGAGSWSLPGGNLDFGELFEQTARREVGEEANIEITNVRFGAVTNDIFAGENKHYVTIWMLSDWKSVEVRNMEPAQCTAQSWHTFDDLPSPLFFSWNQLFESDFLEAIKFQLRQET
jgi:8-oxo-dGTP diphosphatase